MSIRNAPQVQLLDQPSLTGRTGRPFGLKALIVLLLIQASLSIVVVVSLLLAYPFLLDQSGGRAELLDNQGVSLISFSILGVSRFIIAIGLWRLRRWAWVWMMVQLAGSMAMDIQSYYSGQPIYLSMLLNVIVVFYLNQQEVQDRFTTRKEKAAP